MSAFVTPHPSTPNQNPLGVPLWAVVAPGLTVRWCRRAKDAEAIEGDLHAVGLAGVKVLRVAPGGLLEDGVPLGAMEAREDFVRVRVTSAEKRRIQAAAAAEGVTVSAWVRSAMGLV